MAALPAFLAATAGIAKDGPEAWSALSPSQRSVLAHSLQDALWLAQQCADAPERDAQVIAQLRTWSVQLGMRHVVESMPGAVARRRELGKIARACMEFAAQQGLVVNRGHMGIAMGMSEIEMIRAVSPPAKATHNSQAGHAEFAAWEAGVKEMVASLRRMERKAATAGKPSQLDEDGGVKAA